jgi:hypothetical protein
MLKKREEVEKPCARKGAQRGVRDTFPEARKQGNQGTYQPGRSETRILFSKFPRKIHLGREFWRSGESRIPAFFEVIKSVCFGFHRGYCFFRVHPMGVQFSIHSP